MSARGRSGSTTRPKAIFTKNRSAPKRVRARSGLGISVIDHAISNIVFSRMKVARFRDLNDPFELKSLIVKKPNQRSRLELHNTDVNDRFGVVAAICGPVSQCVAPSR